ncbi:helix-turn-helix domain-containing protein [Salidesulfovibrio brasiliensis]|uniref:helix-turn-helix domain-containing protein n=1 Tax=Salidesulfovibrio brasiliensis TaxID=221711 RepID=UPI0006D006BB|nr:helix-turn-helix domain-containing protein [Salidesulfovibrio brasiliensis]
MPLLTVKDVAAELRLHEKTVLRMLRDGAADRKNTGKLHGFKLGGKGPWKVRPSELERFVQANAVLGIEGEGE